MVFWDPIYNQFMRTGGWIRLTPIGPILCMHIFSMWFYCALDWPKEVQYKTVAHKIGSSIDIHNYTPGNPTLLLIHDAIFLKQLHNLYCCSLLQIQNYPVSISARCSIPDTRCSSVSEKVQSASISAAAAVTADTVSNSYISYRTINYDINLKTRAFKTIFLVFVVFFICWFPYSVCILVWSVSNGVRSHCQAGTFLLCLGYSNCAVCPIAYK